MSSPLHSAPRKRSTCRPVLAMVCLGLLVSTTCVRPASAERAANRERLSQAGPSIATLSRNAQALRSEDPEQRGEAIAFLSQIHVDGLPAVAQRIAALKDVRLDKADAIAVLERLIALGQAHPFAREGVDPMPDLVSGAEPLLARDRSDRCVAVVEAALLLRSLENMKTTAAGLTSAELMDVGDGAFRSELRRARIRAGEWMLPALIRLRSDRRVAVKRWAQAGVRALGAEDARMAVNLDDAKRLSEVVLAYSEPLDFDAMPTLVRLTRSDRIQVREAARVAVARFGKNAIWQLREFYEELTGRRAPQTWGEKRTAQELFTVIDQAALESSQTAVTRGLQAYMAGDFARMEQAFQLALAKDLRHPQRKKMAEGYAALAQEALNSGDLDRAEAALRKAVFLDDGRQQQAELQFVRAEQALRRGVIDEGAYRGVLELDSGHAGAQHALDRISGRAEQAQRRRKKLSLFAGAGLLLLAAGLVLRRSLAARDCRDEPEVEAGAV